MSWAGRPDNQPCCGEEPGAVGDGEPIARLLHSVIEEPAGEPFARRHFLPPKPGVCCNDCGNADGVSVCRSETLTDDEIRARANALASLKPGRVGRGALVAYATDLRAVRHPDLPDEQQVFVYDDPMVDDELHAVIRMNDALSRPKQDEVRVRIRAAFITKIEP